MPAVRNELPWRRGAADARPPRLVARFVIWAMLALGLGAAAMVYLARQDAIAQAERNAVVHATLVADTVLQTEVEASDFRPGLGASRLDELDRLFARDVLTDDTVRVKLYAPDGTVTYSTNRRQIGTAPEPEETAEVMGGETVTGITDLAAEGGGGPRGKALEVYEAVRGGHDARPVGVVELYKDYGPIAASARAAWSRAALVLLSVLALLLVGLIPLLRRVSRQLSAQLVSIRHQALHDALTGLPNRELFAEQVDRALLDAGDRTAGTAVLLVDLDRFKEVNDTLGHHSGDAVLCEIAVRLSRLVRKADAVARLGGDEFGIVAPETGSAAAVELAHRVRDGLQRPLHVEGLELQVDASIGIAVAPIDGADGGTLLRHADVALYESKDIHQPSVYSAARDHYSPERLALIGELRRAIARDELLLHYQPLAEIGSGEIACVEALVRWQHPKLGLLAPDRFVPLAEHTGFIRHLTRWVVSSALAQLADWRARGFDLAVAVNVSARDLLDSALPDEIQGSLSRHGVPPESLTLEITENTLLSDEQRVRAVLAQLSGLGAAVAVDDFGSGYSSLSHLTRLPIDVLKIDKSFVLNMADRDDLAIVRSTIELGHSLGLRVVAEGVEDTAAFSRLAELRCDTAQGYLISRPQPATELTALLERRCHRFGDTRTPAALAS